MVANSDPDSCSFAGPSRASASSHYIDAWLALLEPDGWTADDVWRLKSLQAERLESDWHARRDPPSGSGGGRRDGDDGRPDSAGEEDGRHAPDAPAIRSQLISRLEGGRVRRRGPAP